MKSKIVKLLKQSTTSNDNEALTAIRMANSMLKKEKLHWDEFFSKTPSLSNEKERKYVKEINNLKSQLDNCRREAVLRKRKDLSPHIEYVAPREPETLEDKIEICLDAMPYNTFLKSIDEYFTANGYLTPGQVRALDVIYNNL